MRAGSNAALLCAAGSAFCSEIEACGLFSFFATLVSSRKCPTTLQVHLGQEQIFRVLAGMLAGQSHVLFGRLGFLKKSKDVPSPDSPQLGLLNRKKHL